MDCETTRQKLNPFLDGELTTDQRTEVRSHLETCPDCSLLFEELKRVQSDVSSAFDREVEVPAGFTRELLSKARREFHLNYPSKNAGSTPVRSLWEVARKALSVSTLILGLLVGGWLGMEMLTTVEQRGPQVSADRERLAPEVSPPRPNPESITVVSFSDAYFELADGQTPDDGP